MENESKLPKYFEPFLKDCPKDIIHIVLETKKDRSCERPDNELLHYIYGERRNDQNYYFCDTALTNSLRLAEHTQAIADRLGVPVYDPDADEE